MTDNRIPELMVKVRGDMRHKILKAPTEAYLAFSWVRSPARKTKTTAKSIGKTKEEAKMLMASVTNFLILIILQVTQDKSWRSSCLLPRGHV